MFGDTDKGAFIPAFNYRRKNKGSILGSSKVCGYLHLLNQTNPVYFISEQAKLNVNVEMQAIKRVRALLQSPKEMVAIFLADSPDVLEGFVNPFDVRDRRGLWGDALAVQIGWKLYEPPAEPLEGTVCA
jgi:hypothetical protein